MSAGSLDGRRVGLIGLGLMGRPMADNLKAGGADVHVWTRDAVKRAAAAADGFTAAGTPRDLARAVDTVIIMVADTPAVAAVLDGPDGVVAGLSEGVIVIDMGTTAPTATKDFAAMVEATGAAWLDAPVSGGEVGAREASLTIMAGGSDAAFARAEPVLRALGRNITHMGGPGAGQVTKAANQVIVGLTIGAVAEAFTLAKQAGVDPAKLREALLGGFAASRVLDLHGRRMVENAFAPGGKAATQRKDMAQALELADSLGFEMPATALNKSLYDVLCDDRGEGDLDHAALIRVIDPDTDKAP
ncbi:NAD(P)-dependent oxidoreductase [Caenispirillum salinarum]|uniref:NAD(P)-dependent oxidoreductase n=1 Tax=Caenispirillum salinarum TaxID=859058 RepID=UPI00384D6C0D